MLEQESKQYHQRLVDGMSRFLRLTPEQGVNNVLVKGPNEQRMRGRTAQPVVRVGLFAQSLSPYSLKLAAATPGDCDFQPYRERILKMELPEPAKQTGVKDSEGVRRGMEKIILGQFPSIELVFAQVSDPEEEAILLYFIVGISPQTALKEVQDHVSKPGYQVLLGGGTAIHLN